MGAGLLGELLKADVSYLIRFEDTYTARVIYSYNSEGNYLLNPEPLAQLLTNHWHQPIFSTDADEIRHNLQNLLKKSVSALVIPVENGQNYDLAVFGWNIPRNFDEQFQQFVEVARQRLHELCEVDRLRKDHDTVFARFESIVQSISQAVVLIDNQGFPGWINQKAANLLGLTSWGEQKPQALAQSMAKFRNAADNRVDIEQQAAEMFASNGKIQDWVWKYSNTSGKIYSVSCAMVLDGQLIGRLWVFEDITFSYQANEQLKDLNTQLSQETHRADEENKAKTDFLSNMSHEIRTPMNGIMGMANLLSSTPLNEDQEAFVRTIKDSSENLLVIINDILDYNKIIAGKIDLEIIEFSISKVVRNTLNLLSFRAKEKGLELRTAIDPQITDGIFKGDPYRLSQVLINLLGNSIKFTETGFVELDISIKDLTGKKCEVSFSVIDSGIGMAPEKLNTMFERFSQAEAGTTRKYGGTGLGLAITKQLVELHEGNLTVSSELEKGSTFTVTIPYEKVITEKRGASNNIVENLANLENRKILLVEDNRVNQKVASLTLQKWGMKVSIAENGLEAIKQLEKEPFDLILMDLQMPEMNGFEATQYIRANSNLPNYKTPIVAMTASAMVNEKSKCFDAGMNGYLSKPFQIDDLYSTLVEYIK